MVFLELFLACCYAVAGVFFKHVARLVVAKVLPNSCSCVSIVMCVAKWLLGYV